MQTFTLEEVEDTIFDPVGDILTAYDDGVEDGLNPEIVEATASELAAIPVTHMCGCEDSFQKLAEKYPNIKIRTCILDDEGGFHARATSSCMMLCDSEAHAEEVGELADIRADVCEATFPAWVYFESE